MIMIAGLVVVIMKIIIIIVIMVTIIVMVINDIHDNSFRGGAAPRESVTVRSPKPRRSKPRISKTHADSCAEPWSPKPKKRQVVGGSSCLRAGARRVALDLGATASTAEGAGMRESGCSSEALCTGRPLAGKAGPSSVAGCL